MNCELSLERVKTRKISSNIEIGKNMHESSQRKIDGDI